ncbi:hypothetical protein DASC09_015650 [Saccharomycopsis crataegensis]|uniref:Uncharacterized protein n=1 Tax=Saccharomycopsis crataegensis TaxID=43959 RepID=A0AAV5QH31_9ASCO|nr:hypothetical protein DASC09_015650 [Saccharomycopsis crataegensis]
MPWRCCKCQQINTLPTDEKIKPFKRSRTFKSSKASTASGSNVTSHNHTTALQHPLVPSYPGATAQISHSVTSLALNNDDDILCHCRHYYCDTCEFANSDHEIAGHKAKSSNRREKNPGCLACVIV